jgi:hypothetical protein
MRTAPGITTTLTEFEMVLKSKIEILSLYSDRKLRSSSRKNHRVDRVPGFLSSRPNWIRPPPHPQAGVAPLWIRGGLTRLREKGWADLIRMKGQTLWYSRYRIIPRR